MKQIYEIISFPVGILCLLVMALLSARISQLSNEVAELRKQVEAVDLRFHVKQIP